MYVTDIYVFFYPILACFPLHGFSWTPIVVSVCFPVAFLPREKVIHSSTPTNLELPHPAESQLSKHVPLVPKEDSYWFLQQLQRLFVV